MTMPTAPLTRFDLGFSSCPNDTFMFHALVHGLVPAPDLPFHCVIEDIEALNERARRPADALPVTKLSVSVLGHVTDRYSVLASGAALGHGCGPLVVTRSESTRDRLDSLAGARVAVPGLNTTAYLLLRLFAPASVQVVPMRFDAIMGAVASEHVDAGVVIHEGRFTYADAGLELVADLGQHWEQDTGYPLPLGVICADRRLDPGLVRDFEHALSASIAYARCHPAASRSYVASLAQELSASVCERHIALYVNAFSEELGSTGRAAVDCLLARGREAGVLPASAGSPWRPM
ncbi:MAG: 1,4-dihydroxy-6-naphthoate synthase [Myxococcales bacterium FL481]|nr:MAG: 1,4-dihydroxy-6-naphthoate synthase [Myxococcales bacterium FL481]